MTFHEAIKVAQEACLNEEHEESGFGPTDQSRRYGAAAAVLARLEAELPGVVEELGKLEEEMAVGREDGGEVPDAPGDLVCVWLDQIRWAIVCLDAAPKERL